MEKCIMPECYLYKTERFPGSERHEVFFGEKNRQKSIEDGLIVFITSAQHRGIYGVHGRYGHELDMKLKRIAEDAWCKYYNKSIEQFIKRYGKNYLD